MNNDYKVICKDLAEAMTCKGGEYFVATKVGENEPVYFEIGLNASTQLFICETLLEALVTDGGLSEKDFITAYDTIYPILHNEYDRRFVKG